MKRLLTITLLLWLGLSACKREEQIISDQEIRFAMKATDLNTNKGGRTQSSIEPKSVLVTILSGDGQTIADRRELTLYKFGNGFLSTPLTLKTAGNSNYQLSEFLVLDNDNVIRYVTPKEGSELAHLVNDPLEIDFIVSKDVITTVTPEVLEIDANSNSADYGYGQFGFKIVKTISAVFSSFIKGANNFEFTDSHLKVEGLNITGADTVVLWNYETDLEAKANTITIKEAIAYRITASKTGYTDKVWIAQTKNNDKIEILFEESPSTGRVWNVAYGFGVWEYVNGSTPTRDGGVLTTSQSLYSKNTINVARLNSDGKVLWKKKYDDFARMGNSLYRSIQSTEDEGFYLGGNISCHLIDSDKCTPTDVPIPTTGWITRIDGSGNYMWSKHITNTSSVVEITSSHTSGNIMVFGISMGDWHSGLLPKYALTELDANGNIVWQKQYPRDLNYTQKFIKTEDGYLVINLYTQYEYVNPSVVKYNSIGEVEWTNNDLPASWWKQASIVELPQGYLITGTKRNINLPVSTGQCPSGLPNGDTDLALAMLTKGGVLQWVKTIGDADYEESAEAVVLPSGNILIGGMVSACRSDVNYSPRWFLMEVSTSGEVISETVMKGSIVDFNGRLPEMFMSRINRVSNNEFIVVGSTNILDGDTPNFKKYPRSSSVVWAMKLKF